MDKPLLNVQSYVTASVDRHASGLRVGVNRAALAQRQREAARPRHTDGQAVTHGFRFGVPWTRP